MAKATTFFLYKRSLRRAEHKEQVIATCAAMEEARSERPFSILQSSGTVERYKDDADASATGGPCLASMQWSRRKTVIRREKRYDGNWWPTAQRKKTRVAILYPPCTMKLRPSTPSHHAEADARVC